MNATRNFATPTVARSDFSTRTAWQPAARSLGDHTVIGTTTERAAWFGRFRLVRRTGPGNPTPGERIPPPDLALRLHSTGAKP